MKSTRINNAVEHIDDDLISGAETETKASKSWIKWTSLAACLALFITIGALTFPFFGNLTPDNSGDTPTQTEKEPDKPNGLENKYKGNVVAEQGAYVFPWEYKLINEKFSTIELNGANYSSRGGTIDESLLGDAFGVGVGSGYDDYTDKFYTESFNIRKINGLSEKYFIAVEMENSYYVYFNRNETAPSTLGELIETYNLTETLSLSKFIPIDSQENGATRLLSDDAYIWQILLESKNAETRSDFNRFDSEYMSFIATSETLGAYKLAFYISKNGYIATNLFDYICAYYIGEDATARIIDHANENSIETEKEQYEYRISGKLTEIGEGYILIDDTALCTDPEDGTVFKIITEDKRISRYLDCGLVGVGNIVVVSIRSDSLVIGEDNTVKGAYYISQGIILYDVIVYE